MQNRKWERAGISPSLLGYGTMRLPVTEDGTIEKEKAEEILNLAIENGVNYIDTAYPYLNGQSETFLGEYLKRYDRKDIYLATKLPVWLVESREDAERIFDEQRKRLQTDYVDFYLFHAMDRERFARMEDLKIYDLLKDYQKQGKIRYIGFSFHDNYETFEKMLKSHPWDFVQIQYNYMDTDFQAGEKGLNLVGQKKIPVVVMEPIRGGSLLRLPDEMKKYFTAFDPTASMASWPLRWVAGHEEVKVILSGMGTKEQVMDNIQTLENPRPLSKEEHQVIEEVKKLILTRQRSR